MSTFIARQCCNLVTDIYAARFNLTLKTSECVVRSADSLYRKINPCSAFSSLISTFSRYSKSGSPSYQVIFSDLTVTLSPSVADNGIILTFQVTIRFSILQSVLRFYHKHFYHTYKVHLIYGKHKVTYTHKLTNSRMTSCLNKHAL